MAQKRKSGDQSPRTPFPNYRAITPWLAGLAILTVPAIWWLGKIPPSSVVLLATCEAIKIPSPVLITLSSEGVSEINGFGVVAQLDDIANIQVLDALNNIEIPFHGSTANLDDDLGGNSPAVSVEIAPPRGPFIATFSTNVNLATSNIPTSPILEVRASALAARVLAEHLSLKTDRLRLDGTTAAHLAIEASNQDRMLRLDVKNSPLREPVLEVAFPDHSNFKLEFSPHTSSIMTLLHRCHTLEAALDADNLQVPDMSEIDLNLLWTSLSVDSLSFAGSHLGLRMSGKATSIEFDSRELNKTNLEKILDLPIGQQGLFGIVLLVILWGAKHFVERIAKTVLDRLFDGKDNG